MDQDGNERGWKVIGMRVLKRLVVVGEENSLRMMMTRYGGR